MVMKRPDDTERGTRQDSSRTRLQEALWVEGGYMDSSDDEGEEEDEREEGEGDTVDGVTLLSDDDYQRFDDKLTDEIGRGRLDWVKAMLSAHTASTTGRSLTMMGTVGTFYPPLHAAVIFSQDHIARYLIEQGGQPLTTKRVTVQDWTLVTPLQLALLGGRLSLIEPLVLSVTDPLHREQYINQRINTQPPTACSLHELTLAALLCSSPDHNIHPITQAFHFLTDHGADLSLKTKHDANTLLHVIILQVQQCPEAAQYYREFLTTVFSNAAQRWWIKRGGKMTWAHRQSVSYLLSLQNKAGLTPVALAAKCESPLFLDLVRWRKVMCFPDYRASGYGAVDTFDVTHLASIGHDGKYRTNSAMHVLAHNSWHGAKDSLGYDIVDTEPMKTLLERKWRYYSNVFYIWGVFHILYMALFTVTTLGIRIPLISSSKLNVSTQAEQKPNKPNIYFSLFLITPVIYIIMEVLDVVTFVGRSQMTSFSLVGNGLYRVTLVIFSATTLGWFITHISQNHNQDVALGLALLFGWLFCVFFTRTINFPSKRNQIGAFSIMVTHMLFHDVLPFLVVSVFIMLSFASALHATLSLNEPQTDFSFSYTFYQMLKYFSAQDDPMNEETSRVKDFAKALLSVYGIIIAVLLVNILIAAMNKSYEQIKVTRVNIVARQRMAVMLMLERRVGRVGGVVQRWVGVEEGREPWAARNRGHVRLYMSVKRS